MGCSGSVLAAKACLLDATKEQAAKWAQVQQKYVAYLQARNAWQMILGTFVGIYALIKQYELFKEQLRIAKEILRQQEEYLTLAKRHYNEINLPSFERVRDLYDRYVSKFWSYEDRFMQDAFKYDEYQPDYDWQESRVLGKVTAQFDRAWRQKYRARGKYNAGRPCHDATHFAIMRALATTDAINHAYRYEEHKKRQLDDWYWRRKLAGAQFETDLANRAVSGLNRGVAVSIQGLNAVGAAYTNLIVAQEPLAAAYANLGNFWGSIANGAFQMAGYAFGRGTMMPWMPPPYGGGSYGLYGPGMTNFGGSANMGAGAGSFASGGLSVGAGPYHTSMLLGSAYGGGMETAGGGLAEGLPGPVGGPQMVGAATGNWVNAPGYA